MTDVPDQGASNFDPNTSPLLLDLLAWLAPAPQPYAEVMEASRTSCPRLTLWEDAVDQGLVTRLREGATALPVVVLTAAGRRRLEAAA